MEATTTAPSTNLVSVNGYIFSAGDILQAILLTILILLSIFGSLHNGLIGIKVKKQQYD